MHYALESLEDHSVVVTLREGVVHAHVVQLDDVSRAREEALRDASLLRVITSLTGRTAAILAAELHGGSPGSSPAKALAWAERETERAFDMIREEDRERFGRYSYAEDMEPSVTRA